MEKLAFTRFERNMELALLRLYQMRQIQATDGDEVAYSLVQPGDTEATFPADIPIEHLPIYETVNVLENYAYNEIWDPEVGSNCSKLNLFIQSLTHPEIVADWRIEANFDDSRYVEDGDEIQFNAFGNHYKGILEDICNRATARFNLDEGWHLTLKHIAYLAELNERSVMNAVHAKGTGKLETDGKDKRGCAVVDPAIAREWLSHKENFKPTRGRDSEMRMPRTSGATNSGHYIFIPEARDGTKFLPVLKTQTGYRIGKKESEFLEVDYFKALDALVQMDQPHWRRRNAAGNAGIVAGVHWVRFELSKVQQMI